MSRNPLSRKTVVLADSRWVGHHPTYFIEFTASLLRLGHRVIALCPEPEEYGVAAKEVCARLGLEPGDVLRVGKLHEPRLTGILPGQEHDPVSAVMRWRCLRRGINEVQERSGWRAEFVFLAWLDSYLRFQPSKSLPGVVLGLPWSGLYFRNHHFAEKQGLLYAAAKGDRSLRSPLCASVGVLDERFNGRMTEVTDTKVVVFPDITNEEDALETSAFTQEILRKAKGRKIIGMVSLERRKGFLTMLRIAEAVAGREDWYFVAAGSYCPETCSEEEQRYVEGLAGRVARGALDNLHLELPGGRINDGAEFNSLLKSFDVIYSAYEGFEGSSNALTKGAVFERPLIATRGECVGARVEAFELGLTICEGNRAQGEQAIRRVLAGIGWADEPLALRFGDYHRQHDRNRLDEVFAEIVG
jgi:hypothetical protein